MNRIRELRVSFGIKQADLAQQLNVSRAAMSGYETGKFQADNETYAKMADIFGVSLDYLLGRSDEKSPPPRTEDELSEAEATFIQLYRRLSPESKQLLSVLLEAAAKAQESK